MDDNKMNQNNQTTSDDTTVDGNKLLNSSLKNLMKMNISQDEEKKLNDVAEEMITRRIAVRLYNELEDGQARDEFSKLLEEADDVKIEEFLKSKNIDLKQAAAQEILIYKAEMQKNSQEVDKWIDQAQKEKKSTEDANEAPNTTTV